MRGSQFYLTPIPPLLPLPILRKSEVVDVDCELNLIDRV
jgi:hypothetical protein